MSNKIRQENVGSAKHPFIIYICQNRKCRKQYDRYWLNEPCSEHDQEYQNAVGQIANKIDAVVKKKSKEGAFMEKIYSWIK